jgi:hypothetical protein
MATLSAGALTLADWAKRKSPDGGIETKIAEILTQQNEILEDAVFLEGNLPTGHRSTIRTGLPPVYLRSINKGVPRGKSTTIQVDDSISILEAYSAVDKDLMELNGNMASFRQSEDVAFLESMNQSQAQLMMYGNPASDMRQYLGLAGRYGSLSAGNGQNILDAGGVATANTSIYLVVWGENTVFCPFPKGSVAGLTTDDGGCLTVYDENNNPYQAWQTRYQWKNGLTVKDWRYVVRIANIDTAVFAAMSGTQAVGAVSTNILHLMLRACDRVPNFSMGRAAFYMNRSVYSLLRRLALEKSVNSLALMDGMDQFGTAQRMASFEGIPLRKVDQLLNTEARVV